jgi:hypothetical protein
MSEPIMVSATITIEIERGVPRSFASTVTAMPGHEGIMLEMCWEHTRQQVERALKEIKQNKDI